jgi:hypothetical protein
MEIAFEQQVYGYGDQGETRYLNFRGLFKDLKKLISSKKFLLIFFMPLLIISLGITYVASEPSRSEKFVTLSTLGSNLTLDNYYPHSDPTVAIGESLNWHVSIYNHMGGPQYLALRLKMINSTQAIPDDSANTPSQASSIYEAKKMVPDNSTWMVPLSWSIRNVTNDKGYDIITKLTVNGQNIDNLNIRSISGQNFRMILELWRYDPIIKDFSFSSSANPDKKTEWNQIWFGLKR